jgi:hypothetical protein
MPRCPNCGVELHVELVADAAAIEQEDRTKAQRWADLEELALLTEAEREHEK